MREVSKFNLFGSEPVLVKDAKARSDIEVLNNMVQVPSLNNVKCLLIGNSYARGTGGIIGQGWCYYFKQWTKCDATIMQNAGGDFVATGGVTSDHPGWNYYQFLQNFCNNTSQEELNKYKYVIFGGGYNDGKDGVYNAVNINTQMTQCNDLIRTKMPNAKIVCIPLYNAEPFRGINHLKAYERWISQSMELGWLCPQYSIWWFEGRSNYQAEDGVHLNDSGYARCGKYIASAIFGNCSGWTTTVNDGDIELASGITLPSSQRFRIWRYDNTVQIQGLLNIDNVQPSMEILTMPPTMRPWGNTLIPVVLHDLDNAADYEVIVCNVYDKIKLVGDVGSMSGKRCSITIAQSLILGN